MLWLPAFLKEEDSEQYVAQRMEHQQRADKPYGKASHYFAQGVVLQDDSGGTQYACHQYEEAQPPDGVVAEQSAECHQSANHGSRTCHVFAQFPFQVDNDTDDHHHQGRKDNAGHVPWDIEPVHHEQAEYIGSDGQDKGNISLLPFHQIFRAETVDLAEDEDGQCRHQYSEAIHYPQYNQFVLQRHDAQVREYKQNQKSEERNGERREYG